jgi:hypothetical protein
MMPTGATFVSVGARLLADDTLYSSVWDNREPLFYIGGHTDSLRRSRSGRDRNDSRIGAGFRTNGPYLSPANARSRQDIANRTRSRGLRIRPDLSTRRSLPITRGTARSRRHCRPSRGAGSSHPFFPHALQRARWRSRSLYTSAPHRMTATAQARGDGDRNRNRSAKLRSDASTAPSCWGGALARLRRARPRQPRNRGRL